MERGLQPDVTVEGLPLVAALGRGQLYRAGHGAYRPSDAPPGNGKAGNCSGRRRCGRVTSDAACPVRGIGWWSNQDGHCASSAQRCLLGLGRRPPDPAGRSQPGPHRRPQRRHARPDTGRTGPVPRTSSGLAVRAAGRGDGGCGAGGGGWGANRHVRAPRTSLSDRQVRFTVPDKPYVVLRREPLEAVVVDNRAGRATRSCPVIERVFTDWAHSSTAANPGISSHPTAAGLNSEHIHDGTVQERRLLLSPATPPWNCGSSTIIPPSFTNPNAILGTGKLLRYRLFDGVIELTFECIPHRQTFKNGYIGLFWANYIHAPESLDIHFIGCPSDQPRRRARLDSRGLAGARRTGRAPGARRHRDFPHDAAFPQKLVFNGSHYHYVEPWDFGVCRGMFFAQLFRPWDEVRLSQSPQNGGGEGNPAWDFQWFVARLPGRAPLPTGHAGRVPTPGAARRPGPDTGTGAPRGQGRKGRADGRKVVGRQLELSPIACQIRTFVWPFVGSAIPGARQTRAWWRRSFATSAPRTTHAGAATAPAARAAPRARQGPNYEPAEDVDPMPDYENVLTG